jgi:UDP-2,3-diacylglucosamine pyrophosphatase LpxH
MLVIISDLHLTDGSTTATIDPGAFDIFADRLRDLAQRASWRADGSYRPIEHIDLVLLGDMLDVIRSARWLQTNIRPWDDVQSPQMAEQVGGIVDDILRHNSESLTTLRSLAADGAIGIAPATVGGEPAYSAEMHSVPVLTHYMVGNHDWQLHLRGASYDLIRQKVAHHLGLANRHTAPFPHDPIESDELLDTLRRHRVMARHGDIYDPLNFTEDRDASSLGDAIVIELVGRFVAEVEQELAGDLPDAVLAGLQQIDNIRPLLLIPVWIDGLLERSCPTPAVRKHVKQIWDRLADAFLQLDVVRDRDTWSHFDLVDGLEGALKFSKRLSIGWASKIAAWTHSLRGAAGESYYQHAMAEQDFRNRRARHIVYGHTHQVENLPLDASYADGFVLNQMYFNSGTWRRVYRQTQFAPGEHEFIAAETMSYLSFFQADERSGRPFETWTGTLGTAAADTIHRPQPPRAIHAAAQPVAPTSVPLRSPHFATAASSKRAPAARRG